MIRNPEIQFASADAIAAFQQERLREEIAYLYENSPYYRRMFDHCGARPGDIRTQEDLRRLPVTTKTDLQAPPAGFHLRTPQPHHRLRDHFGNARRPGDVRPHGGGPRPAGLQRSRILHHGGMHAGGRAAGDDHHRPPLHGGAGLFSGRAEGSGAA